MEQPQINAIIKMSRSTKRQAIIVRQNGKKVSEIILKPGETFEQKEAEVRAYYTKFVKDFAKKMMVQQQEQITQNKKRLEQKYAGYTKSQIFGRIYTYLAQNQKPKTGCKNKTIEIFNLEDEKDFYVILTSVVGVDVEPGIWLHVKWKPSTTRSNAEQKHKDQLNIDSYLFELIEFLGILPNKENSMALKNGAMRELIQLLLNRKKH